VFEKRKAEKAVKAYEQALSQWQAQRDGYTEPRVPVLSSARPTSAARSRYFLLWY
jgi:hypothetical protein